MQGFDKLKRWEIGKEDNLFHSEIPDTASINLHFSSNSSSDHITDIPHTQSLSSLSSWLGIFRSELGEKKKFKNWGSCEGCIEWKEWRESCDWNQIFHMIPEYMAWIPEQTCCLFTMQLLRTVWKGKDWKHGARIIKGSPKITGMCCTYWQQHSPGKADRKHSSTFDEKNKFCTFVKVFPPTLYLLFVFFRKTVSSSPVVLMFSSLK